MSIMKQFYSVGLLVVCASVFLPISAQSQEVPVRGPMPFAAYDKDGDGLISEEEFNAVRGERMATRTAEDRPMGGAAGAPSFAGFDTNRDGRLTHDELTAGQKAQTGNRPGHPGMGMGHGRGTGKGMGMGKHMPAFSEFDVDGDGKILAKEFYKARRERVTERAEQGYQMKNLGNAPWFADIDSDGNGEISPEEFAGHQSQRHQERTQ